jgi:DNA-directed RNA polymerase specialized sigma24 family protein
VELRHFGDMSYQEIAHTLDIPLSDVKSRLFRGRRKLRERLGDVWNT